MDKGDVKEIRLFDKALTHDEIKNNIFNKATEVYSIDHLVRNECKLYDLIREDGEKLTVTSETTGQEIKEWSNGMEIGYHKFYNQVNENEETIEMNAPPYENK